MTCNNNSIIGGTHFLVVIDTASDFYLKPQSVNNNNVMLQLIGLRKIYSVIELRVLRRHVNNFLKK